MLLLKSRPAVFVFGTENNPVGVWGKKVHKIVHIHKIAAKIMGLTFNGGKKYFRGFVLKFQQLLSTQGASFFFFNNHSINT